MSEALRQETPMAPRGPIVTIKKYANRRLYNTASSSYVTLEHLAQMVKDGIDFAVYDAKTGEEITRSVLTQIIVEEEGKGTNLLPIGFLRQLIAMYGGNMQWLVPQYLEQTMQSFSKNQEQMREMMQSTFGSLFPFSGTSHPFTGGLEKMSQQNVALMQNMMKLFTPFTAGSVCAPGSSTEAPSFTPDLETVKALQAKLAELQAEMEKKRG